MSAFSKVLLGSVKNCSSILPIACFYRISLLHLKLNICKQELSSLQKNQSFPYMSYFCQWNLNSPRQHLISVLLDFLAVFHQPLLSPADFSLITVILDYFILNGILTPLPSLLSAPCNPAYIHPAARLISLI